MRSAGVVDSADDLGPSGHLCWAYTDRADLRARAAEYLSDGLACGQRIEYVADRPAGELRAELATVPGGAEAADVGRAGVSPVESFYAFADVGRRVVEPYASVQRQVTATKHAIAEGFTGFRAIVDVTAVTGTSAQRDAMARFEYLVDRKMSVLPVSALCAIDAHALGGDAVAEMACLHPFVNAGSTQFRFYAHDDTKLVISGELDIACEALWAKTLARTLPLLDASEVIIECRELTFVDHRSLMALDAAARRRWTTIEVRSPPGIVRRLADLLGVKHLKLADDGGQGEGPEHGSGVGSGKEA